MEVGLQALQNLRKLGGPEDVFGRAPNDAIVSSASQHNGGTGKDFPELLHSSGVRSLGFTGPSVVENLGVGQFVIGLLNTPRTDRSWFVMVP